MPPAQALLPRIAIVTGSNKGIGFSIAQQLLPTVTVLILACRDRKRGEAAATAIGGCAVFEQLDLNSESSIDSFASRIAEKYGKIDVLVNNAAFAFKGSDPTPFEQQTEPTLKPNFHGTVRLTEALYPLLESSCREGRETRVVNVASMTGRLSQLSPERQNQFADSSLEVDGLIRLVREFESDVAAGQHSQNGWGNSNYGFSKLALIAYTKLKARQAPQGLLVNCCCPGYCESPVIPKLITFIFACIRRHRHDGAQRPPQPGRRCQECRPACGSRLPVQW